MTIERVRLAEIVHQAPIPILVLRGAALLVERANDLFQSLAAGAAAEGQPLDEALASVPEVARGVREALDKDAAWTSSPTAVAKGAGCSGRCVFIARPLHEAGLAAGVVVYVSDFEDAR